MGTSSSSLLAPTIIASTGVGVVSMSLNNRRFSLSKTPSKNSSFVDIFLRFPWLQVWTIGGDVRDSKTFSKKSSNSLISGEGTVVVECDCNSERQGDATLDARAAYFSIATADRFPRATMENCSPLSIGSLQSFSFAWHKCLQCKLYIDCQLDWSHLFHYIVSPWLSMGL